VGRSFTGLPVKTIPSSASPHNKDRFNRAIGLNNPVIDPLYFREVNGTAHYLNMAQFLRKVKEEFTKRL
jgi:hypothetical protein